MVRPRRRALLPVALAAACAIASMSAGAATTTATRSRAPRVVRVGQLGNEPLVAAAPDGTLYIAALQYLYRSTDHGAHWASVTLPPESGVTEYKTDSSISVDPGGRLYYTFDYPYAGTTAVCTSDNRGASWSCDPVALPGGTDRMWITSPTRTEAFFTTNEATYQPVFSSTHDRGSSWQLGQTGGTGLNPYTGRPIAGSTGPVIQPVDVGRALNVDIYSRSGAQPAANSDVVSTGLPAAFTGPSGGITSDGTVYLASEAPNEAGGRGVVVARSADHGRHWTTLPDLPGSHTGTAIFTALATGANGHVGVLYYWTPSSADPLALPATAVWYAAYVDSADANRPHPHWRLTMVARLHHTGLICRGFGCDLDTTGTVPRHTADRFAGDFLGVAIDGQGYADLAWMGSDKVPSALPADPSSSYGDIDFARIAPGR